MVTKAGMTELQHVLTATRRERRDVTEPLQSGPQKNMNPAAASAIFGLIAWGLWMWVGADLFGNHIADKVARDAVEQYDIAKRNGTAIDRCVSAGFVTAAYLQAKDEANYATWKAIETADCK